MRRAFCIWCTFLLGCWAMPYIGFAYEIKGIIHLDDSWQRVIYLSAIRSFEDMNAVSEDFIINVAPIAGDGSFVISGNNLPEGDGLYRLHVCKIGDPPATLFIGGQEENHIHFVMNNRSELFFYNENALFEGHIMSGSKGNDLLWKWNSEIEQLNDNTQVNTKTNWEYKQQQLERYAHYFADTCSNGFVAMLALHQLDVRQDYAANKGFYENFLQKWKSEYGNTAYYQELLQQIEFARYQKTPFDSFFMIVVIILAVLAGILVWYRRNAKGQAAINSRQLSIQEQKVFDLLVVGKANKEISNELNIEVSTVKSHVSSIYAKLGVKSRKEIYNRKEGDS